MNKIFLLLIAGTLFSQINVNPKKMNNFQDAFFMERKGEIEDAKITGITPAVLIFRGR